MNAQRHLVGRVPPPGAGSTPGYLSRCRFWAMMLSLALGIASTAHAIMAGGETALPPDSPAARRDLLGAGSPFNAVGALQIASGGFNYRGSGTALSPHWVITAGHNFDLNDNGVPDAGVSINFHLPGFGVFPASAFYTAPGFTGFGNPSVQRDLGLLYLATPLPAGVLYPSLSGILPAGAQVALVGFGRSGYGNYGYTTSATLTDRRSGYNVVDTFTPDDLGGNFSALFRYDFDAPDTVGQPGGSLGNAAESLIAPGDSGGPVLIADGQGWALAGVSTFTEGYGGRFGDTGGGIVLSPYLDWLGQTTGIAVPEPSVVSLAFLGLGCLLLGEAKRKSPGLG